MNGHRPYQTAHVFFFFVQALEPTTQPQVSFGINPVTPTMLRRSQPHFPLQLSNSLIRTQCR